MYSGTDDPAGRVAPFGNLRINVCLPTPRSLSQASTSFFACNRQGIHHVHLVTCPYNTGFSCEIPCATGPCHLYEFCNMPFQFFASLSRSLFSWILQSLPQMLFLSSSRKSICVVFLYFFRIVKDRTAPGPLKTKPNTPSQGLLVCVSGGG